MHIGIAIDAQQDTAMTVAVLPHIDLVALQARLLAEGLRQCQAQRRPVDRAQLIGRLADLQALLAKAGADIAAP